MNAAENDVNEFFLQQMVKVGEARGVFASEDIVSTTGMKLVAKGKPIDQTSHEHIISHKLREPLEQSIQVEGAISTKQLAEQAEKILDAHPALKALSGWKTGATTPAKLLAEMQLSNQARNVLTLHEARNPEVLPHFTMVALIALGLNHRLQKSSTEVLSSLATASVFHDVGEMYLNPALFTKTTALTTEEWTLISAHPAIGQKALENCVGIDRRAIKMVAEHHERCDGSGYPAGITANKLSPEGHMLAVAEMVAGLMEKNDHPIRQLYTAMKILPGEYAKPIVDLISKIYAENRAEPAPATPVDGNALLQELISMGGQLYSVDGCFEEMKAIRLSERADTLAMQIDKRFRSIQRAFFSAGMHIAILHPNIFLATDDEADSMRLEAQIVANEIKWRLRELSRQISGKVADFEYKERAHFETLMQKLSEIEREENISYASNDIDLTEF